MYHQFSMNLFIILLLICTRYATSNICEVCQDLVKEFHVGIKDSDKSNFGGGNTAWEEERLGSFATSETRLIHILDGLCPKTNKNVEKCHYFREESEEHIEKWWFEIYRKENKPDSLYDYLCINNTHLCCPINHYGKNCDRCMHFDLSQNKFCSDHGKCSGNGTRDGNGTCLCDSGYEGDSCNQCTHGYYNSSNGTCEICHPACIGCTGVGSSFCINCSSGYQLINGVCEDQNECSNKSLCVSNQFCNNLDGSYECLSCDSACSECNGTGPENCLTCKYGYHFLGSVCEDIDECTSDSPVCPYDGQKCINTKGGYICDCLEQYEKQPDGSCIPIALSNESKEKSEL